MTVNFKPLHNRILVKPYKTKTKIGNILLPDTAQKVDAKGEVIIVPDTITNIKPKDAVLFHEFTAISITLDNENYVLINKSDIKGVIPWEK